MHMNGRIEQNFERFDERQHYMLLWYAGDETNHQQGKKDLLKLKDTPLVLLITFRSPALPTPRGITQ